MSRPVRKTSSNLNIDQDFPGVGELEESIWSIINEKIDRYDPPNSALAYLKSLDVSDCRKEAFLSLQKPAHEAENHAIELGIYIWHIH